MTDERGYTIIELLVAAAVMLTVVAGVAGVLHAALLRVPWLEESTDLQQRTRAALELLSADLRAAGASDPSGTLATHLPIVLPRTAAAAPTVPAHGAAARLGAPLLPADALVVLDTGGVCVSNGIACGFRSGATALVSDRTGQGDLLGVDAIAPGAFTTLVTTPRLTSYALGADVTELLDVTYTLDAAARILERQAGGVSLPLADNVTALSFEYEGSAARPREPTPPSCTPPSQRGGRSCRSRSGNWRMVRTAAAVRWPTTSTSSGSAGSG
jgi:hypothetical protein